MQKTSNRWLAVFGLIALGWLIGIVSAEPKGEERERKVTEKEVPPAALAALKKLAGGADIQKFEEEFEHETPFYEASWKTTGGRMEALVTATGDLVETEEGVQADALPKAVLDAAHKMAGQDAKMRFEKKTSITYEIKFKKGDTRHEVLLTPAGHQAEHEEQQNDEDD